MRKGNEDILPVALTAESVSPHDLSCDPLVPGPISLPHLVHRFSPDEMENLTFKGQLDVPLGMVFPQIYLGHGVGLDFLHTILNNSWHILRAPMVHYFDDILVSKRHAQWTLYTLQYGCS